MAGQAGLETKADARATEKTLADLLKAGDVARRRAFIERCAVAWCSDSMPLSEHLQLDRGNGETPLVRDGVAAELVADWSALWDAIEADEQKRRETP